MTSNPFSDHPSLKKTIDDCEDLPEDRDADETTASTYMFNRNYKGPDMNSTILSMLTTSSIDVGLDGKSDDRYAELSGRNRVSAMCSDFGQRVVSCFNAKPYFFVNVALISISFAFFLTCLIGFFPMSIERQYLSGSLNDTTKLLQQCSHSFELLQEKMNETTGAFSQCIKEKDTSYKLLEATEKEKVELNNVVAELRSKIEAQNVELADLQVELKNVVAELRSKIEAQNVELADLHKSHEKKVELKNVVAELRSKIEAQNVELADLHRSLAEKVNSAPAAESFWGCLFPTSSSPTIQVSPFTVLFSVLYALVVMA